MESTLLNDDTDLQALRELSRQPGSKSTIVDFEEQILLPSIRAVTRIWKQDQQIVGFAFVDEYNNIWFESGPQSGLSDQLENEIIDWGEVCIQKRNAETGEHNTLDSTCEADNRQRIAVFERHGFVQQSVRSLHYARPLSQPIGEQAVPAGYSIRCVKGKEEVEQLVALQRAAFGTENMSVEYRLAMMSTPQYVPELDLLAVAPDGELAALCVCGFDDPDKINGYTDPIGTHPAHQRRGLGKAIIAAGLRALKNAGAQTARLGTSSENSAMQKLAEACGFACVSEKLWFAKVVP